MPHPLLQSANIYPVLQVPSRVCVTEFVKKPATAEGAVNAAIDFDGAVVELVRHSAMSAIELGSVRNGF